MREESETASNRHAMTRITPAHAGRMPMSWFAAVLPWDHPRACGKNSAWHWLTVDFSGSPPRMREEFFPISRSSRNRRITPAHAGRIRLMRFVALQLEDHPRACGKNIRYAACGEYGTGSPPRMREESYW